MWELGHKESWTPKNYCFWTVVLEKTLESPLDCKIKPVNPKVNQPWTFIGRLMLKLKLQYFGHLMWRTDSFEKTLMLGKIEGRRGRGQQRMRGSPIQWTWVWVSSRSWWWTGKPGVLQSKGSQRFRHDLATEQQNKYTHIQDLMVSCLPINVWVLPQMSSIWDTLGWKFCKNKIFLLS